MAPSPYTPWGTPVINNSQGPHGFLIASLLRKNLPPHTSLLLSQADSLECLMVRTATLAVSALSFALNLPVFAQAPTSADQGSGLADQAMGRRFEVRVDALPKPYESTAVRNTVLTTLRGDRRPVGRRQRSA